VLTARGEEHDIVVGLELGADDYITKPFKVREVVARVRAVLRRAQGVESPPSEHTIRAGAVQMDLGRHEVQVGGKLVELTPAEFRLLRALLENADIVLTRNQLVEAITAGSAFITDRNVDVHIRSIRRKLETIQDKIITVRGVGYKFQARESETKRP
jgi:DNA-binding response OmpR family regulator